MVRSMGCPFLYVVTIGGLECPGRVAVQECVEEDRVEADINVESVRGPLTHKLDYMVWHPCDRKGSGTARADGMATNTMSKCKLHA